MESGMSHQDRDGHTASAPHHQGLKLTLDWLLEPAQLANVAFREDCTWTPKGLIFAAILWTWSDEKALTERFFLARKVVAAMGILPRLPATSYQAFLKLLRTWTVTLSVVLHEAFRRRMQTDLADRFRVCGYTVFGVDGSRLELPRTESNEQRFSPAAARRRKKPKRKPRSKPRRRARSRASRAKRAREKKVNSPQMWLTTMFHVGTGLPWDWRTGPSDSSERDHMRQMLDALPADALITADAGFVGYEYWKALLESRRHFLIRVGANVRLLKGLGYVKEKNGLVYLWPDREAARNQPPLVLRLVVARGERHPMYLVTSVRDEERLSDKQVVEIYALRWGVELFYRNFKQTFERRKLRSHAAANAELEATWSLLGLWAMCLHGQVELARAGIPARRVSVAQLLRAYRRSLHEYKNPPDPGESLRELLLRAVIDPYHRANKASRDYPRKKQGHATGAPKIGRATRDQINAARKIRDQLASGLTA
jgi:hypothetical protein